MWPGSKWFWGHSYQKPMLSCSTLAMRMFTWLGLDILGFWDHSYQNPMLSCLDLGQENILLDNWPREYTFR